MAEIQNGQNGLCKYFKFLIDRSILAVAVQITYCPDIVSEHCKKVIVSTALQSFTGSCGRGSGRSTRPTGSCETTLSFRWVEPFCMELRPPKFERISPLGLEEDTPIQNGDRL